MRSSSLTFTLFFVLAACGSDKNGNLDDFTACGEYETTFTTSDSVMVTLSGADLASEIQGLCDSAVIADPNRCEALQAAANMAGDIEVSVAVAKLENAASRTVDVDFDNAYCRIN